MTPNPLRGIPSVNEVLESPPLRSLLDRINRSAVTTTARMALDELRAEVRTAASERTLPNMTELAERIARRVLAEHASPLRPVINATGTILHPDLGSPPLALEAVEAMAAASRDYACPAEGDVSSDAGEETHAAQLLREQTGAEAALIFSRFTAARWLVLAALSSGREALIARGEIFHEAHRGSLLDVAGATGTTLAEVGTVNRTVLEDYAQAAGESTAAVIRAHGGTAAMVGSTSAASLGELASLARGRQIPLLVDAAMSGLVDLAEFRLGNVPIVREVLREGADLVLFEGDQLIGGPPCGLVVGRQTWIERIAHHPLARGLGAGRPTLAALAATLRLYQDADSLRTSLPLVQLLSASAENLQNRAERLAPQLAATGAVEEAQPQPLPGMLGEIALPGRELPGWGIMVKPASADAGHLAAALRSDSPAVVGAVVEERLCLNLRSVLPRQDLLLVSAFEALDGQEE